MGAFHWSKRPKTSKTIYTTTTSYEWNMKNSSSSKFLLPRKEEEEEEEEQQSQHKKGKDKDKDKDKEKDNEEEETARCEWDFNLSTVVSSNTTGIVSDTLGSIEIDPSDNLLATGGIARKIRIYNLRSLLRDNIEDSSTNVDVASLDHASACDYYMCTPAKLSSLRWKPGSGGRVLGSGDYDGVVMEYDLERRVPIFERDEHGGRRVWSVDYSHWDPVVAASGSDDGTMQIWDPRIDGGKSVATVQPSGTRSSVCCVEFNPSGNAFVAVGCTDRKAYGYDVRKMVEPVLVFDGHCKAVTYVKFLDHRRMVSAGIDGCLKLWNTDDSRAIRTYKGHVNSRSFVGLSVWKNGGLLGCGSENNQVFVYDVRWGDPIWVRGFGYKVESGYHRGFVSSVCWRQLENDRSTLIAGGSDGVLQVFVGKKKSF